MVVMCKCLLKKMRGDDFQIKNCLRFKLTRTRNLLIAMKNEIHTESYIVSAICDF